MSTLHLLGALNLPQVPPGWTLTSTNVTKSAHNPLLREGLSPWDMAWWNE